MTQAARKIDLLEAATAAGFRPGSPEWQREVRKLTQRRTQEEQWERAAVRYRRLWDRAAPSDGAHPYLRRKKIVPPADLTVAWWLRQIGDRLLLPMKGLEKGAPLMSLQSIWPDGRKLFSRGGRAARTRTTIGADGFKADGTLYVCEGWATGWSVHHVTEDAVVVAFSSGNLADVAMAMRERYPKARIIVCADNDRFGSATLNPGVAHAREAAAAARAEVTIPDFTVLDTKPTDFNDLYVLEGPEAVRRWLDPARAGEACTSPPVPIRPAVPAPPRMDGPELEPPPEAAAEPVPPDDRPKTWQDLAPFRCLGYDHGTYYYLPRGTGQITHLEVSQHDRKWLFALAPASWWQEQFPAAKGADWHVAADALLRASERAGMFRPERLRGRGCWPERNEDGDIGILLHLGDRLLPPGAKAWVDPERYEGPQRLIYERQPPLVGPSPKRAMPLEEAREVLSLFEDLRWHDEASGALLAGWTVLAPICGALTWRPHVWVTGGTGAGKTEVLKRLVVPLLGGPIAEGGGARYYEGGTTEAGIRQGLRADAIPVVYDEAEQQDAKSDTRIQSVLALARSASSTEGAHTAKGTTYGSAMSFQVRSMFCLASIGGAVRQEADKTRIALLQLRGSSSKDDPQQQEERRAHWARYAPRLADVTVDMGRELFARTLRWLRDGRLDATLRVCRAQAAVVLGNQRAGDQYGTLLTGTWMLMADEPPAAEEARELISSHGLGTYISEQAPEGLKVLRVILQQEVRVDTKDGPRTFAVGQLVDACMAEVSPIQDDAERWLRTHGLLVNIINGGRVLELANTSQWIAQVLRDTPYSDGWHLQLRTLPGVQSGPPKRFHGGLTSRITIVPKGAYD